MDATGSVEIVCGGIRGFLLKDRYKIDHFIDRGQFGAVYAVTDSKKRSTVEKPLVVKVAKCTQEFRKEIKAMAKIQKASKLSSNAPGKLGNVPKVKDYGKILQLKNVKNETEVNLDDLENGNLLSYVIMYQNGITVESYLES